MNIEQWPLERLREYAKNPRKNDHAIDSMAEAIKAFGFRVPILARSSGEIVDGHLRYKAAKKLALETVPIILADDMTDVQIKAFRLSVNKAAEWAQWDFELLKVELGELKALDFEITSIGFDQKEMIKLFPEDNPPNNNPMIDDMKFSLVVECENEIQQGQLLERLEAEGLKVRAMML